MHEENICMQDNGEPHTTSSIASLIDHSPQSTKAKLNRLIEMNLLDHSKAKYGFKEKKVFRINPHIIKKGRQLNKQLPQLFNDVAKTASLQSSLKDSKLNKPKK
jgi:Mn-dependent DtxR family transcriptional regulator